MDYSLLLGVHDVDAAEEEDELVPPEGDDGDEEEGLDEEYDSGELKIYFILGLRGGQVGQLVPRQAPWLGHREHSSR